MKILIALIIFLNNVMAAGIKGSKHDFSANTWSNGEICIVCHTPHGANTTTNNDIPLWNHAITSQVFIPYTSATMKATVGQPDGSSKLCLSCHDGTIAIDSFNGLMGTTKLTGKIGPNLLTGQGHWQHPISIVYNTALSIADTRLNDPIVKTTILGGTINTKLLFYGKLQCNSCHDVHNTAGNGTLLRITEPTLCNTCHK